MLSAELLVAMVGPFNIIGNIYCADCIGPSIAVGMASEDDSGPIWHNWQRFDQRVRAHLTLSAELLVTMVGPFNIIGNIYWLNVWVLPMLLAELPKKTVGPFGTVSSVLTNVFWPIQ